MTTTRTFTLSLFSLLFLALCAAPAAHAQAMPPPAQDQQAIRSMASAPSQSDQDSPETKARMAAERGENLQKKVDAQSAQLLALAQKLKADVAKSNEDQLSVAVVKEAEEIEKLAKSIKKNADKAH
jgi:hypothetical protein